MFLHWFEERLCGVGILMEVKLPRKGLELDPRAHSPHFLWFNIPYHGNGITVSLNQLDDDLDDDYDTEFQMRIFDPKTETLPDFNMTIDVYYGLDGEYAPYDTIKVIIHPSVKIIQPYAFA